MKENFIVYHDGSKEWWKNGKLHRTDGPAYTGYDGSQSWWVHNTQMFSNKDFQKAANLSDEEMTLIILKYGNIK